MSLIEAMTMAAGLVYLVLLAWQARSGWPWCLALGLLFLLWLVATDSLLWLALGLVVVPLALWHRYRPQPALYVVIAEILAYSYLLQGKFPEHWQRQDGSRAIDTKI